MSIVYMFLIMLFVILAGFFSGAETGMVSANRVRFRRRASKKDEKARYVDDFLANPEKVLGTTLVGTNLSIVAASTLAVLWLHSRNVSADKADFLATLLLTPVLLVFSEIIPKSIFRRKADHMAYMLARILSVFHVMFWPAIKGAYFLRRMMLAVMGEKDTYGPLGPHVSRDGIRYLIYQGGKDGTFDADEKELLNGVVDLRRTYVKEVMVPRVNMVAIDVEELSVDEVLRLQRRSRFSRIPVYRENMDDIIGLLHVFDLLDIDNDKGDLSKMLRTPFFVPETMRVGTLMARFQKTKIHAAIVVDEYGGTAGLVTLEDLLEEIFGEIQDVYDEEPPGYRALASNRWLVDGSASVDLLNDELSMGLPETDNYDTVAGWILYRLQRVPEEGETLIHGKLHLKILKADARRIIKVEIVKGKSRSKKGKNK